MSEEMDGLSATFERVKIPSGGGIMFEIPSDNPDEPKTVKEFSVVILYQHSLNAYYKSEYKILDSKGVLVETNTAELQQFALLFEFSGDKNKIRHCLYCCSASRPATEGQTVEDSKEVKTETLSLTSTALASGLVKSRSCEQTDKATYDNWYKSVYMPDLTTATVSVQSAKSSKTTA